MDMDEPSPQEPEPIPSSDLLKLAACGAAAALVSGFVLGYMKVGSSMKYFMTSSYFGDGAVAGLIAGVIAFLVCSRFAERVAETLERRQPTCQYVMIMIGGGIGLVVGIVVTIMINVFASKAG